MKAIKAFLRFFKAELQKQAGSFRFLRAGHSTFRHSLNFLILRLPLATKKLQKFFSFYYKFVQVMQLSKPAAVLQLPEMRPKMPTKVGSEDFTVIIPVYGNLGLFDKLLRSINLVEYTGLKLIVVDDRKDETTSRKLANLLGVYGGRVELIVNEKNLGFLRSVNKAAERCTTRFAVLLNSDVELPKFWLERFANAIVAPGVALATALATQSGANLTITIPKGRTWMEADSYLSSLEPRYPSACTAIGYALAIDLEKISLPLFDDIYIDGYGEDSDLHYRCTTAGHRSIVVDNLLVRHASGASYVDKPNLQSIRSMNAETFQERWGRVHSKKEFLWSLKQPIRRSQIHINMQSASRNFDSDIVLLVPTEQVVAGGIAVALELQDELNRSGVCCRTLPIDEIAAAPYMRLMESKTQLVVATGIGTYWISNRLANQHNAQLVNFLQGPELFFENGLHFEAFRKFLPKADLTLAVSPYLSELASIFGARDIVEVALGPDLYAYYDEGIARKKQLVISSRLNFEKGTVFSLPALEELANSGWSLISVGPTHPTLHSLTYLNNLGELPKEQLRKLLSESMALLDLSIFEGLGLMPQEALACGCHVILQKKGGTETVLNSQDGIHWLSTPLANGKAILEILERLEPFTNKTSRSLDLGTKESVHAIKDLLKRTPKLGHDHQKEFKI